MMALLLVGQEPHGQHPEHAPPDLRVPGGPSSCRGPRPSPCMPRSRGTENPQMSASRIADGQPPPGHRHRQVDGDRALADAPFARGDGDDPCRVGDVGRPAPGPGPAGAPGPSPTLRWSASITPVLTSTHACTPGSAPTWVSTSLRICVRSGHPATVRATSTATVPPPSIPTEVTIPSSTMSAPSSGSTTPRSAARTASVSGGPHGVVPSGPIPSGPIPSAGEGSDLLTGAIVPVDVGGPAGPLYRIRSAAGTIARDNHHPGRRHGLRVRAGAVRWGACRPSS
jgi:hypothetical protein